MTYREVQQLLRAQPFQSLAFTFTDGNVEIVKHPEMALPGADTIVIAKQEPNEDAPWLATYSLQQLISVKPADRIASE